MIPRATTWQRTEPPKDRGIVVHANIKLSDADHGYSHPYTGYAEWKSSPGIWVDQSGMAVCESMEETLRIFAWIDEPEGAK